MAFNSLIKSRDIFDELLVENQRLLNELLFANNCVNKLKTLLTQIYHKFDSQLSEEETHKVNEVKQEVSQSTTKNVLKISPTYRLLSQKHRKRKTKRTKAVDIKDVATDDSVKQPINCPPVEDQLDPFVKPSPKSRKPRVPQWTTPADLLITDMTTDDSVVDYKPNVKQSVDKYITNTVVKKRRRRSPKSALDPCGTEELEVMRQKYISKDGVWDDRLNRFICPKIGCDLSYELQSELYNHLLSTHKMKPIGLSFQDRVDVHTRDFYDGQRYVCGEPGCLQQPFNNQLNFYRHLIKDHRKLPDIVCEFCKKVFKKSQLYSLHKRIHTNTKPYSCHVIGCDYRCRTKPQLNVHLRTHSDERPFRCEYSGCIKAFRDRQKLREHQETHDPNLQIPCTEEGCQEIFKSRYWRTIHINTVHKGLSPEKCKKPYKRYVCDWPGCEFSGSAQNLKVHKSLHTGERPFPCEWPNCGKRFCTKQRLADHLNTHMNIKPHACHWPGCSYRSNDSGNLRKHITASHK